MFTATILQLIVEIVFFAALVLLLVRLGRQVEQRPAGVDAASLERFAKLLAESQGQATRFLAALEEKERSLQALTRQLDSREKRLMLMIEEAQNLLSRAPAAAAPKGTGAAIEGYDEVVALLGQGTDPEEVARRTGMTEGEVSLVAELARIRSRRP